MSDTPHYFPLSIDKMSIYDTGQVGDGGQRVMPSLTVPNLISRTKNTSAINATADAFEVVTRYGNTMEQWWAMSPIIRDFNVLHQSKAFKQYMEANDKGSFSDLMKAVEIATGTAQKPDKNRANDMLNRFVTMHAAGAIGFRFSTAFKQLLSYPAFATYSANPKFQLELLGNIFRSVPVYEGVKSLEKAYNWLTGKHSDVSIDFDKWASNWTWAMENLPSFRQRAREGDMGLEGLHDIDQKDWFTRNLSKWGMIMNRGFDKLTVAAGARAVYNEAKRRYLKAGKTDEDAHKWAVIEAEIVYNQSQQSSRPEFSSYVQKSTDSVWRSMLLFQNANIGYCRQIRLAAWNAWKIANLDGKREVFEDGHHMFKEGEKGNAKKAAKFLAASAATFANFGIILPYLWQLGGYTNAVSDIADPDSEMNDEDLNNFIWSVIAGSTTNGTTFGPMVNTYHSGWDYDALPIFAAGNELIEEYRDESKKLTGDERKDIEVYRNIELAILDKMLYYGIGFNIDTYRNITDGVLNMYEDMSVEDAKYADLYMDWMLLINSNKTDRRGWARELYKEYGPVAYAKAYEKASQQVITDRKRTDVVYEYIRNYDEDYLNFMTKKVAPLYKEYVMKKTPQERIDEIEADPMFEYFANYQVFQDFTEAMKANIKTYNPEGSPSKRGIIIDGEKQKSVSDDDLRLIIQVEIDRWKQMQSAGK